MYIKQRTFENKLSIGFEFRLIKDKAIIMRAVLITLVVLAFIFVFLSDAAPQGIARKGEEIDTSPGCTLYTCT